MLEGDILGTCFAIGDNHFLTAAHVVRDFAGDRDRLLVVGIYNPAGQFIGSEVVDSESFSLDIALLQLKHPSAGTVSHFQRFRWRSDTLPLLADVQTVGYAYGMQPKAQGKTILHRAFKGYLVSSPREYLPPSADMAFPAYELSFSAPRGLSGSPLFASTVPSHICGVVIGNSESKMLVLDSSETVSLGSATERVERYESLSLGLAIRSDAVMELKSRLLGVTLGEHLKDIGLLVDSPSAGG